MIWSNEFWRKFDINKMMKYVIKIFIFAIFFSCLAGLSDETAAQKYRPSAKPKATATPKNDQAEFEKVQAIATAPERIAALQDFLNKFPKTALKNQALELIATSRADIAEDKLKNGAPTEAIGLFRQVVNESPTPYSSKLHDVLIAKIPFNFNCFQPTRRRI